MTDTEIENVYKSALPTSHYAGLRAVYDSGRARTREEFEAGLASPEPPPTASAGETSDEKQTSTGEAGTGQPSERPQEPAAEAAAHPAA